jgi:hypothetical protein
MADSQKTPPFYEQRWFQGAVALIGLATTIWALVGAPKPWQVAADLSATKLPLSDTELVLDASSAMGESFGHRSKLDAAADAIGQYVVPLSHEGLALRRAGGECDEAGELLVDFGSGHSDDVQEAAAEQQPEGSSNMSYAVRAAIDDFTAEGFRNGPSAEKRILIFTGGEDECAEYATDEIRDALQQSGIETVFRLVALGATKKEEHRLEAFKRALAPYADVEIRAPSTEAQLEEVMRQETAAATESAVPEEEEAAEEREEEASGEQEEETTEEEEEETNPEEETAPEEESTSEEEIAPGEEIAPDEGPSKEEATAEESSGAAVLPGPMFACFVELHPATDLHPAFGCRVAEENRAVALVDRDLALKPVA